MLKAASMLEPRVNAASVYFDGTLWVTGGQSNTGILDTTEYYVFTEDRWIKGQSQRGPTKTLRFPFYQTNAFTDMD